MIGQSSKTSVGTAKVVITNGGPHTPEAFAELCTGRLVSISDDAAPHLRQQGQMFRDKLLAVITKYMRQVAATERERVAQYLDRNNQYDLAARVRQGDI